LELVLHDHAVEPRAIADFARTAEGHCGAGYALQFDEHVLEDVRQVSAFAQPLDEPTFMAARASVLVQRRQKLAETFGEPRKRGGRLVDEVLEIDDHGEAGTAPVNVGATQHVLLDELHVVSSVWTTERTLATMRTSSRRRCAHSPLS